MKKFFLNFRLKIPNPEYSRSLMSCSRRYPMLASITVSNKPPTRQNEINFFLPFLRNC